MAKPNRKTGKLPQREIDICERVREVRIFLKWDQPAFAKELDVSRERLASYEYARAPVRYWLARKLCMCFGINQRWLALGKLPMRPYIDLDQSLDGGIHPRMLFSAAFDDVIGQPVERQLKLVEEVYGAPADSLDDAIFVNLPATGMMSGKALGYALSHVIQTDLVRLPQHLKEEYFNELRKVGARFLKENSAEIKNYLRDQGKGSVG